MGDPNAARRAALAAAEAATDRYAYEVAATYASMALDALDAGGAEANEDAERAAVLIVRGEAHLRAADLALATGDFRTALDHAWRASDERRPGADPRVWDIRIEIPDAERAGNRLQGTFELKFDDPLPGVIPR